MSQSSITPSNESFSFRNMEDNATGLLLVDNEDEEQLNSIPGWVNENEASKAIGKETITNVVTPVEASFASDEKGLSSHSENLLKVPPITEKDRFPTSNSMSTLNASCVQTSLTKNQAPIDKDSKAVSPSSTDPICSSNDNLRKSLPNINLPSSLISMGSAAMQRFTSILIKTKEDIGEMRDQLLREQAKSAPVNVSVKLPEQYGTKRGFVNSSGSENSECCQPKSPRISSATDEGIVNDEVCEGGKQYDHTNDSNHHEVMKTDSVNIEKISKNPINLEVPNERVDSQFGRNTKTPGATKAKETCSLVNAEISHDSLIKNKISYDPKKSTSIILGTTNQSPSTLNPTNDNYMLLPSSSGALPFVCSIPSPNIKESVPDRRSSNAYNSLNPANNNCVSLPSSSSTISPVSGIPSPNKKVSVLNRRLSNTHNNNIAIPLTENSTTEHKSSPVCTAPVVSILHSTVANNASEITSSQVVKHLNMSIVGNANQKGDSDKASSNNAEITGPENFRANIMSSIQLANTIAPKDKKLEITESKIYDSALPHIPTNKRKSNDFSLGIDSNIRDEVSHRIEQEEMDIDVETVSEPSNHDLNVVEIPISADKLPENQHLSSTPTELEKVSVAHTSPFLSPKNPRKIMPQLVVVPAEVEKTLGTITDNVVKTASQEKSSDLNVSDPNTTITENNAEDSHYKIGYDTQNACLGIANNEFVSSGSFRSNDRTVSEKEIASTYVVNSPVVHVTALQNCNSPSSSVELFSSLQEGSSQKIPPPSSAEKHSQSSRFPRVLKKLSFADGLEEAGSGRGVPSENGFAKKKLPEKRKRSESADNSPQHGSQERADGHVFQFTPFQVKEMVRIIFKDLL